MEDTLSAIATGHDMVYCTLVLNAKRLRHAVRLPRLITLVNRKQGLTPAKFSDRRKKSTKASGLSATAIGLTIDGGDGDNVLIGGDGNDILLGGVGDDVLLGGPGVDVLDGGPGDNILIQ